MQNPLPGLSADRLPPFPGSSEWCDLNIAPAVKGSREWFLLAALAAATRGWAVFPLVPGGKRPAVSEWESRATTDPERIRRCWTTGPYNVGVACGPSGLVVADTDMPKPGQVPPPEWAAECCHDGGDVLSVLAERAGARWPAETFVVQTPSDGRHYYYTHPGTGPELRNTQGSLGWLVDTRAHGGYVVGPGSIVGGGTYTPVWEADPQPLPGWLAVLLEPAPLPPQEPVVIDLAGRRKSGYLTAAVDAELRRVKTAEDGGRNHALYVAAVALGQLAAGGALSASEVTRLLEHAGVSAGLGMVETARTVRSGIAAGGKRPRSVAA
ncbi:bifunctional DNA primase/polymerase [Longispora albida]|uniref:bifunctional DNA primase/polymerase n=1 Tax=Longispora albida TaxID=203523 RepID=UPI0003770074|nr:bifunctional DNA primase/polymerase [Longispora albida]